MLMYESCAMNYMHAFTVIAVIIHIYRLRINLAYPLSQGKVWVFLVGIISQVFIPSFPISFMNVFYNSASWTDEVTREGQCAPALPWYSSYIKLSSTAGPFPLNFIPFKANIKIFYDEP